MLAALYTGTVCIWNHQNQVIYLFSCTNQAVFLFNVVNIVRAPIPGFSALIGLSGLIKVDYGCHHLACYWILCSG